MTDRTWNSEKQRWEYPHLPAVQAAIDALAILTPEARMEAMGEFCKYCGDDDPGCQCWNDE